MSYSVLRKAERRHQAAMVSKEQIRILFFTAGYKEGTGRITNKPNKKSVQQ